MGSHIKPLYIRIFIWTAVVLWLAAIFFLSEQMGSQITSMSDAAVRKAIEFSQPGFQKMTPEQQFSIVVIYQYVARKAAHVIAFMLLGALCMTAFYQYRAKRGAQFVSALTVCSVFAGIDEIHQIFVAGRSALITDIFFDTFGALIGIGIVLLIQRLRNKMQKKYKMMS